MISCYIAAARDFNEITLSLDESLMKVSIFDLAVHRGIHLVYLCVELSHEHFLNNPFALVLVVSWKIAQALVGISFLLFHYKLELILIKNQREPTAAMFEIMRGSSHA